MLSRLPLGPISCSRRERLALPLIMALVLGALACALYFNGRHIDLYAYAGTLVFAALALTICARPRTDVRLGPAGCLLFAFCAWNALAMTWTSVPYVSMFELGVLFAGLGTYLIWRIWNAECAVLPTGFLFIALGLGLGALMFAQHLIGLRPHAMLLNPNSAAGFLNFLWPFAAVLWLDAGRDDRIRMFGLAAVFVLMTALALAHSRGATLGAIAALVLVAFVGFGVLRDRRSTLVLIAVFVAALVAANSLNGGAIASDAATLADPSAAGSDRFTIWRATWEMIQEHPWLGYGPGVFWLAYSAYRPPNELSSGQWVHNDYLEFWVETGLPGVAIVVGIGAACLWLFVAAIIRHRRHESARGDIKLATGVFAAIAGVACHSFFTFNLQMMPFILVLGILLAELERACHGPAWAAPRVPSMRRVLPAIGLVALTLIVVGHFTRTAIAFHYVERGSVLMQRGAYADAAEALSTARGVWSQLDAAWYLHANVLLEAMRDHEAMTKQQRRALVTQAVTMLDRAERYNPHRAKTPLVRGLLRADHPELTTGSAKAALRKSIALNPRGVEARYALSQLLEREGNYAEAMRVVQHGLAISRQAGIPTKHLDGRARELRERIGSDAMPATDESAHWSAEGG